MMRNIPYLLVLVVMGLVLSNCKKAVEDIDQTAALKNVIITYDSMAYQLDLPAGISSGKSFQQLRTEDSLTYTNPENYSVTILANMHADNNKADARDAKFDGMTVNVVMSTHASSPIETVASPFTVLKNTSMPVVASDKINLKTHKPAMLYMFKQMVDGNDMATTLSTVLNYKIGTIAGSIAVVPELHKNIPTRANQQTKDFLKGLLDSGVFSQ